MLDLHGNLIKVGAFVKNRAGLIAEVKSNQYGLVAEYPDGHKFFIDDSYAEALEVINKVNHWSYMGEK